MLCSSCQTFLDEIADVAAAASHDQTSAQVSWEPYTQRRHQTIKQLEDGSTAGCTLCRNTRHTWAEWEWKSFKDADEVLLELAVDNMMPIIKASVRASGGSELPQSRMIGMYLREAASEGLNQVLQNCSVLENKSTSSPASFKVARFWLQDCLQHHDKCPKPRPYLPTRVLDVGPADGSQDPYLYENSLTRTPLADDAQRYAALSHCWGPPPWFRTTQDTLASNRERIRMTELPPTFRDAVTVTRQLGLRYLWIDSLCIIQEDAQDWKNEAVRMCDYYSNAVFTITSARSDNSHGGLFAKRDGIRIVPFVVDVKLRDRTAHCQFSPMPRREIVYDTQDLQLYKRAWVLQEMILSRRAIIYDPDVVRWECLTSYGSERSPDGGIVRHHVVIREIQNAISVLDSKQDIWNVLGEDVPMRSNMWQHVIEDFMDRGLTNESDRLIAIAGVAQAIQRHTPAKYVAGLWKNLLPYGLSWHVRHSVDPEVVTANGSNIGFVVKPPPYRSKEPIAPSWSFASVNVAVRYTSAAQDRPMCQVIDAAVEGQPHSQTGVLTLHGDTRTLYVMREQKSVLNEVIKMSKDKHYRYEEDYGLTQGLLRPDSLLLISTEPPGKWRRHTRAVPGNWYPDVVIDSETPVTFIAITQRPRLESMPSQARAQVVHTLALVKTDRHPSEYRRVGYAAWEDCTWYGYDCCEFQKSKTGAYRRLAKSWSTIKPPQLAANGTEAHEVDKHTVAHDPLPAAEAYHSDVNMTRQTITIV